jgi:cell division GTPase FtsZ
MLNALACLPAWIALPTEGAIPLAKPKIVGFGSAGERILKRFLADVVNAELGGVSDGSEEVEEARSLVIVAGLGGPTSAAAALRYVREWRGKARIRVAALLTLPLVLEGERRARGLIQAEEFVNEIPRVAIIDNQPYLERVPDDVEPTMADIYDRVNVDAVTMLRSVVRTYSCG